MNYRFLGLILVVLTFSLAACTAAVEETSLPEVAIEPAEPAEPAVTNTALPTPKVEPTQAEAIPTAEDQSTSHSDERECSDPFEGGNVHFSTVAWATDFCNHSVPYDEFLSGGPPRDGIPPIDNPIFVTIASADEWLDDVEPVIAVDINDDVRAYPLQILIWHEIVNDEVGGRPVLVTFCPLCNTALVFYRPSIENMVLTFGTTGNLRNSDLVMWDRQTESWWQQFSGEAIVGDMTGTQLEFVPTGLISWADFKARYPEGEVLSLETGFSRQYGSNPYGGYDNVNESPFLYSGDLDDRLPPMARVLGFQLEAASLAISLDKLIDVNVVNTVLNDTPVVAFWKTGTSSAVEAVSIADGRDVGTTGVFLSTVDDQVLTFSANGDGTFTDDVTGSVWDIFGESISGNLAGTKLLRLQHHDTFWFAWAAFVPEAVLTD
jgi:hypothetical protein